MTKCSVGQNISSIAVDFFLLNSTLLVHSRKYPMRFNVLQRTFGEGMNGKHALLNWGLKIKIERCPIISGIVVSWKKC